VGDRPYRVTMWQDADGQILRVQISDLYTLHVLADGGISNKPAVTETMVVAFPPRQPDPARRPWWDVRRDRWWRCRWCGMVEQGLMVPVTEEARRALAHEAGCTSRPK
jgi:hypothetical protein